MLKASISLLQRFRVTMSVRVDLSNLHTTKLMWASSDMKAAQTDTHQDAPVKIIVFFYTCGSLFNALQIHCIIPVLRHDFASFLLSR